MTPVIAVLYELTTARKVRFKTTACGHDFAIRRFSLLGTRVAGRRPRMIAASSDLADRWRRARCSALQSALPQSAQGLEEEELVLAALEENAEKVLRRVFDRSRQLGEGFRRYYKLDLPLSELVEFLPRLGVSCLQRDWVRVSAEPAYLAEHTGCDAPIRDRRVCDYWREAINGLVLGMTGAVLYARHESVGRGGSRCVDALYVYPDSAVRFGPIPDDIRPGLEAVRRMARNFDSTFEIEFLGISESVLFYRAKRAASGSVNAATAVERGVKRRFPWLSTYEITPRAVLGEGSL